MRTRRAWGLLAVYLTVLAVLTLVPALGPALTRAVLDITAPLGADKIRTIEVIDAAVNVALFIPGGFLLSAALPRLPLSAVWAACAATSLVVEGIQALALPLRTASWVDVLTDALGAAVGVLLAAARRRRSVGPAARANSPG